MDYSYSVHASNIQKQNISENIMENNNYLFYLLVDMDVYFLF